MKKLLAVGTLLGAIAAGGGSSLAHAAPADEVTFNDPLFKACVAHAIGVAPGEPITEAQLAAMTGMLDCVAAEVTDISPIAHATGLSSVYLEENHLTDLSPLAGLTNLTSLVLSHASSDGTDNGPIRDISPLSGLSNLRVLTLTNNQIVDVAPLAGLTNLISLDLSGNMIIDASPLEELTNTATVIIETQSLDEPAAYRGVPVANRIRNFDGQPLPLSWPAECTSAACTEVIYPSATDGRIVEWRTEFTNSAGRLVMFSGAVSRAVLEPALTVAPNGLSGTGEPGAVVTIVGPTGEIVGDPISVATDGTWEQDPPPSYAPGVYTVQQHISGIKTNTTAFTITVANDDETGGPDGSDSDSSGAGPDEDAGIGNANGSSVAITGTSPSAHENLAATGGQILIGTGLTGLVLAAVGWILVHRRRHSQRRVPRA